MNIEETLEFIEDSMAEDDNPIVWLTGDAGSLVAALLVQQIKKCPVMIFPTFWDKEERDFILNLIERFELTAYYFNPLRAEIAGGEIISEYQTDCFKFSRSQKADINMWEKLMEFELETKLIPSYLWTKTFAHPPLDVEVAGRTEFFYPLARWSREDIAKPIYYWRLTENG